MEAPLKDVGTEWPYVLTKQTVMCAKRVAVGSTSRPCAPPCVPASRRRHIRCPHRPGGLNTLARGDYGVSRMCWGLHCYPARPSQHWLCEYPDGWTHGKWCQRIKDTRGESLRAVLYCHPNLVHWTKRRMTIWTLQAAKLPYNSIGCMASVCIIIQYLHTGGESTADQAFPMVH